MNEDKPASPDAAKFAPVPLAGRDNAPGENDSSGATGKVLIGSLDEPKIVLEAQYNPKELELARGVSWQKTNEANKGNKKGKNSGGSAGDDQGIHLEFTGAEGRSLTLELLFDGYEQGIKGSRSVDVMKCVETLEQLASVRKAGSKTEAEKRPHRCIVTWGKMLPSFSCVIESLSTKYTMFDSAGKPLRATCTLKLKEANVLSIGKKK